MGRRRSHPTLATIPTAGDGFRLEPRTATRVGVSATLAGGAIGILFGALQVQNWTAPKPIALALIAVLAVVAFGALSAAVYEVIRAVRRFLEHRATSASWVLSEPPGLLDYEADGVRAGERFTEVLESLTRDTATLGKRLQKHAKRMERLKDKSGKAKQRRADKSAKDIARSASYIEKRLALLKALVEDIYRNTHGMVTAVELTDKDAVRVATDLRDMLDSGRDVTVSALSSLVGYRDTTRDIESQNLSRSVRIASKRLADALDGVATVLRRY